MSKQERPITDQEQPLSKEGSMAVETPEEGVQPQGATTPPVEEQHTWQTISPSSFVPRVQSPYAWPRYYPEAGPQWPGGGQFGPYYPSRRGKWPWIVLTVILLCLLIAGGLFAAFGVAGYANSVTETQHFIVSAHPTLVLNNDTGSIHMRSAGAGNEVTIQATKHSAPWGNLNEINVSYVQDKAGNSITVNVDRLPNASFMDSASVDFDITVPSAATLQLKTNTGSIDVTGVSGQMMLSSNTGSVAASNGTVSGTTELISNTGSITFNGALDQSGTYRFETNTGSVNVTLTSEIAFHMDASTDTGSINTNVPGVMVQHRQFTGADAHGDVGSTPRAMVSLRTNTGSIDLYQR